MSNEPQLSKINDEQIYKVVKERYQKILYCYFYGSRSQGLDDQNSDLDIIIVVENVPTPFREKFRHDNVLFDAFIYDEETLNAGLHAARVNGSFVLVDAVMAAKTLPNSSPNSLLLQEIAKRIKNAGYLFTHQMQLRQFITNILDDLETCVQLNEKRMLSIELYRTLVEIALIFQGEGICSRKHASKTLMRKDPALTQALETGLSQAMLGNAKNIISIAIQILQRLGGPLREGFCAQIPNPGRMPLPVM